MVYWNSIRLLHQPDRPCHIYDPEKRCSDSQSQKQHLSGGAALHFSFNKGMLKLLVVADLPGGLGARAPPMAEPVEPTSAPPKFFCHWRMERRSLSVELRLKTMLERWAELDVFVPCELKPPLDFHPRSATDCIDTKLIQKGEGNHLSDDE